MGILMCVDGLFKFGQRKKIAIIPNAFFSELLLLAIRGLYTKLKLQEGWVTSKYLTEIRAVSEFLHGMRKTAAAALCPAVRAAEHARPHRWRRCGYSLLQPGRLVLPEVGSEARELPTWEDVPGRTALLASSLSPVICV